MDFLDPAKFPALIAALAPGFLIMFVRRQFLVGKPPSLQDRAVTYLAISAVYFAVSIPTFAYLEANCRLLPQAGDFIEYFALPIVVGFILALVTTHRGLDRAWQLIGLQPIHHIPSAWDYMFGNLRVESWVIVTLNDGSSVAGKYDRGSFASSDGGERDLLISQVWEVDDGVWSEPPTPKSILLCGRDIRTVEVFKMEGRRNVGSEEAAGSADQRGAHTAPEGTHANGQARDASPSSSEG